MHYILVHGACHGSWCWEHTTADLERLGHQVSAPDLPLTGFADDVACVTAVIDASPKPVVVAGHSYGGLVISEAAAHRDNVAHLVYVTAMLPEATQAFVELQANTIADLADSMTTFPDGTFVFNDVGASKLYNRCEPDVAADAQRRLRPMLLDAAGAEVAESWRHIPTTYVVCREDQAISAANQRAMAANAGTCTELDADHSPFFSATDALCDALNGVAERAAITE